MSQEEHGSFEKLIESAKDGGWGFLDQVEEKLSDVLGKGSVAGKQNEEDHRAIVSAFQQFAATSGGAKAMQWLVDQTINKTVFITHLGYSAEQVAIFGAHREGANQLVWQILKLLAEDTSEENQPKTREARQ